MHDLRGQARLRGLILIATFEREFSYIKSGTCCGGGTWGTSTLFSLYHATAHGTVSCVKILIDSNANTEMEDMNRKTRTSFQLTTEGMKMTV